MHPVYRISWRYNAAGFPMPDNRLTLGNYHLKNTHTRVAIWEEGRTVEDNEILPEEQKKKAVEVHDASSSDREANVV